MSTPPSDFYALLQIPRDASPTDIKIAYHHTLFRLHPDKRPQSHPGRRHGLATPNANASEPVDVALLKEAYKTLSDASLRGAYDAALRRGEQAVRSPSQCPRPAQIVSLEEFSTAAAETRTVDDDGTGIEADTPVQEWWHGCRCGGTYRITQCDLENGTHLVGCESCSEVIWVGYEEAPVTDEEEEEEEEEEAK